MAISRRTFAAGLAGVAAVGVAGGVTAFTTFDETDLVARTLERLVGPVRFADDDLARFVADFRVGSPAFAGLRSSLLRAGEVTGLRAIAEGAGPAAVRERFERFERDLLSWLLVGTSYLEAAQAQGEPSIRYSGPPGACVNPFARFEPEGEAVG